MCLIACSLERANQEMRRNEGTLSMNRPTHDSSQDGKDELRPRGVSSPHGRRTVVDSPQARCSHEPVVWSPDFSRSAPPEAEGGTSYSSWSQMHCKNGEEFP